MNAVAGSVRFQDGTDSSSNYGSIDYIQKDSHEGWDGSQSTISGRMGKTVEQEEDEHVIVTMMMIIMTKSVAVEAAPVQLQLKRW